MALPAVPRRADAGAGPADELEVTSAPASYELNPNNLNSNSLPHHFRQLIILTTRISLGRLHFKQVCIVFRITFQQTSSHAIQYDHMCGLLCQPKSPACQPNSLHAPPEYIDAQRCATACLRMY